MQSIEAVNILLVDDDPAHLRSMQAMLAPLRGHVLAATTAEEVLRHVLGSDFAVILISTPLLNGQGVDIARMIRERSRSNRTPILFLSADDDTAVEAEQGYALGLVDFLRKPLNPIVLRAKIGIFVELFRRSEELTRLQRQQHAAVLELRDSRMKLILENTKDYAFVGTDRDGIIREWIGGAEAITGWSAASAIGKPLSILFTEADVRDGRPELERRLAVKKGRTDDKRWHLKRDGSRFYADGVMVALHDADRLLQGFAKIFRDATVERRASDAFAASEARLRDQHERVRVATHAGGLGMWTWSANAADVLTWENDLASEIFGAAGSALAHTMAEFCARYLASADAAELTGLLHQAIADGLPFKFTCRFLNPNATAPRSLALTGRYYAATAGHPALILGTLAEIPVGD